MRVCYSLPRGYEETRLRARRQTTDSGITFSPGRHGKQLTPTSPDPDPKLFGVRVSKGMRKPCAVSLAPVSLGESEF